MTKDTDAWIRLTEEITGEILDYLSEHPDASDTPEGIALWWIKRQRYEVSVCLVRLALDDLVKRKLLDKAILGDGNFLYSVSLSPKSPKFLQ